jgi:hypothetical protein
VPKKRANNCPPFLLMLPLAAPLSLPVTVALSQQWFQPQPHARTNQHRYSC